MSHSACINLYSLFSAIPEDGMKEEDRIEDSPDERISREWGQEQSQHSLQ